MIPLIAPISHSALCLLTFSHNGPQDQPCFQTIQHAYTSAEKVVIASEQAFYTVSLHHSTPKRRGKNEKQSKGNGVSPIATLFDF